MRLISAASLAAIDAGARSLFDRRYGGRPLLSALMVDAQLTAILEWLFHRFSPYQYDLPSFTFEDGSVKLERLFHQR